MQIGCLLNARRVIQEILKITGLDRTAFGDEKFGLGKSVKLAIGTIFYLYRVLSYRLWVSEMCVLDLSNFICKYIHTWGKIYYSDLHI